MNMQRGARKYYLLFLLLAGFFPAIAQYSKTSPRSLKEGEIAVSEPGYYGEPGATYVLVNDIHSDRSAIFIGNNVTLDLNGYEIVYADAEYEHIPNYGFEVGLSGWDLSKAPSAKIEGKKVQVFVGENVLSLKAGEEITSGYVNLPVAGRSYYAMCGVAKIGMNVSVYVEDESGEVVYSTNSYGNTTMQGSPVENKGTRLGGGFVVAHFQGKEAGKYRVRVKADTDVMVDHIDIRPALDVGVGIVERTWTNVHTDHLFAGWYDHAFYDYTSDYASGAPLEGIPVVENGAKGTIVIKNGTIRSGARGILSWGIQSTAGRANLVVDNVKIESAGINTNAMEVIEATITNCLFDIKTPFIINRHNSGNYAVDLIGTQASEVSHSEFYGGQGCLSFRGANSKVHNNLFVNRQTVTNHYSIGAGGSGSKIYDNIFKPEIGSGIGTGGRDIEIFRNEFHIQSAPPSCEYGHEDYSTNAIRLADYNAKPGDPKGCFNNRIHNNKFFITGKDYPDHKDYIPIATALFYSASAGDNFIYDNEVVVNALNPGSKAETNAFYIGGGTIGGVFENNVITTNVPAFWLASLYGNATKTKVVRNKIINSSGENDDSYFPIRLGARNYLATDIEFVSNDIIGGKEVLEFGGTRREHTYTVSWALKMELEHGNGNPVQGENIKIYDKDNKLVFEGTSSDSGTAETILKEYSVHNRLEHSSNPYRIVVGKEEDRLSINSDTVLSIVLDPMTITSKFKKEEPFSYKPNPVENVLFVDFRNDSKKTIRIIDINQKVYFSKDIRGKSAQLDVSMLPAGSYFVQVIEDGRVELKKLVKN